MKVKYAAPFILLTQSPKIYDFRQESPGRWVIRDTCREDVMLTRRGFAGFASCAICGITEFIATEASAQGAPVAVTPGLTRKILAQMDGPMPGYVTVNAEVEIEPGVFVARHTHPGIESGYLLEGGIDLAVQGQPTRSLKPGDGFQVPRRKRLMLAARMAAVRRSSQSRMSWRKASPLHLQPEDL